MNTYIVTQMVVESQEIINNIHHTSMDCIVRKVEASSREEAIGKFVIATEYIKVIKKLDLRCYDLTELITA